jgi:hypothetical protein
MSIFAASRRWEELHRQGVQLATWDDWKASPMTSS